MTDTTPDTSRGAATAESALAVARRFYEALASNDGSKVVPLLTEDFVLTVAEGMPQGLGGVYHGPTATNVWCRIWDLYYVHGEPAEFLPIDDDRVVVLGRYVGEAPDGGPRPATAGASPPLLRPAAVLPTEHYPRPGRCPSNPRIPQS